jgi:hypothetical protein
MVNFYLFLHLFFFLLPFFSSFRQQKQNSRDEIAEGGKAGDYLFRSQNLKRFQLSEGTITFNAPVGSIPTQNGS